MASAQGRAVNPRTLERWGLKTQPQNSSGVGTEEILNPEHNFSALQQDY